MVIGMMTRVCHKFSIQSDRADRSFIKQLVEAQYPAKRVTVNNVKQQW